MNGHSAENDLLPCCRGEGPCQAPPDIGPCDPLPSAENEATAEPRNRYVNDDMGECWAQGCTRSSTHLLTTRSKPDDVFPQGLLTEAGYCWHDAVWFAGATVAINAGTVVSLEERPTPLTTRQGASDA